MIDSENDGERARRQMVLRGRAISEDESGLICLDDLWTVAGGRTGKAPRFWRITQGAKALIGALKRKVGIPNNSDSTLIHAGRGRGSRGTFAHPILAAAYAGYLDPKLEVEVREVWLRYRAGDATLADEILQRATAEANHWAGVRALSRTGRNSYTAVLKAHGVIEKGYMECTEAVYLHLLGGKSYQLRERMGLPKGTNLRNHFDIDELAYVMAAEALAAERIEEEQRQGNSPCAEASAIGARAIRVAVDADRRNRQRRLIA
jgi:hypothetical protein